MDKAWDCLSLGEVMLRLDPGEGRIRAARQFTVWEGGGEYNVARALSACFGLRTAVVTALPANEMGALALGLMRQGGVDTSPVIWREYDGLGRSCRLGLNFTERGFGVRGALGVSDRGHSAASQLQPGDVDWDDLFVRRGTRWFHTGGIFAALGVNTARLALQAVQAAKASGATVSFDFNYRPSLWAGVEDADAIRDIYCQIIRHVDVAIGGRRDFRRVGVDADEHTPRQEAMAALMALYPNLQLVASSRRRVIDASRNGWGGVCYAGGQFFTSRDYPSLDIYDRVGGGDGFASGLIYGLLSGCDTQTALDYAVAHGALAMTTPGDASMACLADVQKLASGGDAAVTR